MFYAYKGIKPVIDPASFVHPMACITGNVRIGKGVYIGPFAAIRGDWGEIIIEDGCNVQENCTIHMFPGVQVLLKENVHVGHGAILHGCIIGENSLIGMNSVLMDNVIIGAETVVGAMTFIKSNAEIPERSLVVGNPFKVIGKVSDAMLDWKSKGTLLYQLLAKEALEALVSCEPLTSADERPNIHTQVDYRTWKESRES